MVVMPAAIGSFLVVNVVCAFIALAAGFAAGVWFFGVRRPAGPPASHPATKADDEKQRATERTAMASGRLVDLAKSMASDVSDHAAKVTAITADIRDAHTKGSGGGDGAVDAALDRIIAANNELQQRLAVAEQQIEAQAAEIRSHETEARTDSLTGLANRRAFDDEMRRRLAEWERKKAPFTLLLLDIDHFKKFNDTHGHQAGDDVLRQVAKVLKTHSRDMDLPCRYGGEEFAVILPATMADGACIVAERIRQAIADSDTIFETKTLKVTSSIGVAEVLVNDNVSRVIKRADEALYKSKEAGRNCGHWHDGAACRPITDRPQTVVAAPPAAPAAPSATRPDGRQTSRSSFIHVLKRRVTESHRFGIPLSVMHLKIDEFEAICRLYGQAIGRHAIEAAAATIERTLHEADVVASLGNGEFVLMLPNHTLGDVNQLAKRLRVLLANCAVPQIDREIHLHFRHSIAELKRSETAQELLARARNGAAAWPPAEAQTGA